MRDYKRKNQPIEDQIRESWDRVQEVFLIIQIVTFLESIGTSIILAIVFLVQYLVFHIKIDKLWNELIFGLIIFGIIIGITFGIGALKNKQIMKEYD